MNQFNIEVDWKFTRSLACSKLNLIVDRFQTNITLMNSHGLLYNFTLIHTLFSPTCRAALHAQLFDTVNVNTKNRKKSCLWFKLFEMSCVTRSTSLSIGNYKFNCTYFPLHTRKLLECLLGISPSGRNPCGEKDRFRPWLLAIKIKLQYFFVRLYESS